MDPDYKSERDRNADADCEWNSERNRHVERDKYAVANCFVNNDAIRFTHANKLSNWEQRRFSPSHTDAHRKWNPHGYFYADLHADWNYLCYCDFFR